MSEVKDQIFVFAPSMTILLLAGLLAICWIFLRQHKFLLWQSCSYAFSIIPVSFQSYASFEKLNRYALLTGTLYLLGAWFLTMSWAERWRVSTQPKSALLIYLVTMAALFHYSQSEPSLQARLHVLSAATGLVMLLPILSAFRTGSARDWLDRILLGLAVIFTSFTFTRPFLITLNRNTGMAEYTQSAYWLISSMSILVFAMIFTVLTVAIAMKETVNQLRDERDHDALTKVLNRRAFHEVAQRRLANRRLYPMAVLTADIDHFKRINDTWGHDRGDEVLKLVSATLQRNVRNQDLVARFGGEEFVLLLTGISPQSATNVAQRIQLELRSDNALLPTGHPLTLSFGIASITDSSELEHSLKRADELLYSAKNAGRDCVHVSGITYPDIHFEDTLPIGEALAPLTS
ncbi:GGDEF domain-containing protein [Comamonas sp. lk]|uniref:GGDEF domain-containing protein n=1 Tax=Comamonas sp. lk TaxID=2201272 RepID=UPI000EB39643|nr:GGDEF domain-containing protein [Comamonas sp. lk]